MSAASIPWSELNVNGKVTHKTSKTSLRCEWKGSGCYLTIHGVDDIAKIELQVELDVISMSYSLPGTEDGIPCIILKISLNRNEPWAGNGTKTWHGDIGINCAFGQPSWDPQAYLDLIKSLSSCFYPPDIAQKSGQDILKAWDAIGREALLTGPITPFDNLNYEWLVRLAPRGWLNGELVMTGLREWCTDLLMQADPHHPKVLLMGEFFFKKLSNEGVQSVASWTKKKTPRGVKRDINIFDHSYIVVVVNWSNNHWILAIIINPANALDFTGDPAMIAVFDSIAEAESLAYINVHLRLWLNHQANNSPDGALNLQTIPAQVPQQKNGYDCGIYIIHFAKTFFSDAEAYTQYILSTLKKSQIMKIWRAEQIPSVREDFLTFIQSRALAALSS